jgi:hypothetical protein
VAGRYPVEFIQRVLSEIDSGQYTAASARHAYRITGKMTVYNWLKNRDKYSSGILTPNEIVKEMEELNPDDLQNEIIRLQKEVEYFKHKSEAYAMMIALAEEQLKVVIKKKSGAKQSKK